MSESHPTPMGTDLNGNGGESSAQADPALHQRLRAVTRDFSHRELAELTGVSLETARRYNEGRGPSVAYIKKLCDALGISADWVLLGRGSPVYRPGVPLGQMDSSVDEVLDGLSRYLKRLHLELARAGTGMQPGGTGGQVEASLSASLHADLVNPPVREVPMDQFADPFADPLTEPVRIAPPTEPAAKPAATIQVRLVLGPFNGRQLSLPVGTIGEILVRLDASGEAALDMAEAEPEAERHRYRRVFDRVYRWIGSSRSQ